MNDSRKLRVLVAAEDYTALVDSLRRTVRAPAPPGALDQWSRSVASVAANIAEAANLGTGPNMARQLRLALASANEAGSHLRRLRRAHVLREADARRIQSRHAIVCKMLLSLIASLDERTARQQDARQST